MWRVTWRNLFARKVRLLLSAFAIVLGVAFVAGTMIFTNAMGGAFDDIIEGSTADVEVAFKGANDFDSGQDNRTFPASVVSDLEALPEVRSANPQNTLQTVFVIGKDGKVIGGNGPPGLAINRTNAVSLTGKPILTLVSGDYPSGRESGRPRRGRGRQGRLQDRGRGRAGDPRPAAGDEGQAHRAGRVRLRRPERCDPDGLRQQVHAGAVLRRPGRVRHGLPQRGRRRLPDRARERGEEGAAGRGGGAHR